MEFFQDATLSANEQKLRSEYYIPTVGLDKITHANQNGAVYLKAEKSGTNVNFTAKVFSTLPDANLKMILNLKGAQNYTVTNHDFTSTSANATELSFSRPSSSFAGGSYTYELILETAGSQQLIQTGVGFVN